MSTTETRLTELLGAPAPQAVQDLSASATARLVGLIETALGAQEEDIAR